MSNQAVLQKKMHQSSQKERNTDHSEDVFIFSDENFQKQLETAPQQRGYYILRFYVDDYGNLAKYRTNKLATFYYLPSGGTLRDENFNIVRYSARYDLYKDFAKVRRK